MKKTLFGILFCFFLLLGSCEERPLPKIASDFVARRPFSVAVLPAVYFPAQTEEERKVNVQSGHYMSLILKPPHLQNIVLDQLTEAVRKSLIQRGLQVKEKEKVKWALGEFKFPQSFNWSRFSKDLQVDTLAFVTLYEWDLKRYVRNRSARVLVEVSLYTAQSGELLWRDRNFPINVRVGISVDNKKLMQILTEKAVTSAFLTFPLEP